MNGQPSLMIKSLGPCTIDSPLKEFAENRAKLPRFVTDEARILLDDRVTAASQASGCNLETGSLELAGPRRHIYFKPAEVRMGIVTCGGLCPGLNDVIRGLVMEAWFRYGVRKVDGFRYGYQGFISDYQHPVLQLDPEVVSDIHEKGGTILSSSRGNQDVARIVDTLEKRRINILCVIGGDGTMRGASQIAAEIERRNLKIAIVGIPKTIDNDLAYVDESFGFQTAYAEAVEAIRCAHTESKGTPNGIGIVKVMGRHSGFLACHATLATSHVNFCLIPEMPLGENAMTAFMEALTQRLLKRKHAVIVIAEGTAHDVLMHQSGARDASGNQKLVDVGPWLIEHIKRYLDAMSMDYSVKYIDPSYILRSVPARPADSVYCWQLAQNAIHAGMAGKTELLVGRWHGRLVHVPIEAAISRRNLVDPEGDLWMSVLETTGQPAVLER